MGNDRCTNLTVHADGIGVMSGTMTVEDASDAYIEALEWALRNRLPVPVPAGVGPTDLRLYASHYNIDTQTIDVTVFGGPVQFLEGPKRVTVEFHAEP